MTACSPIHLSRLAFSLTELLVVTAIIGLLAGMTIPAFNSIVTSSKLTSAAHATADHLNFARQTALTRNTSVEVRFYKLPDSGRSSSGTASVYRAIQLFIKNENFLQPLGNCVYLPSPIIFVDTAVASSLLANSVTIEQDSDGQPSLGVFGHNYKYRAFRFRASGGTDLSGNSIHLSLASATDRIVSNDLPSNFITVQIDPVTGRIRSFRP